MRHLTYKKFFGLLSLLVLSLNVSAVQRWDDLVLSSSLKIGGTSVANGAAAMEINSTTKGLLFPRLSTTQQNAISSPPEGLFLYDNVLHMPSFYNGTGWLNIPSLVSGAVPITQGGTGQITKQAGFDALSPASSAGDILTFGSGHNIALSTVLGDAGKALTSGGGVAPNSWSVLGLAGGGTGQTTKASAFDALSPTQSAGDLAVFGATSNVRVPTGNDTYVLTADSTQTVGLKWAPPPLSTTREYIKNGGAEDTDISAWVGYADSGAFVDGTGGTPTTTFLRFNSNGNFVLRQGSDYQLSKPASNRQGDGYCQSIFLDTQDYKQSQRLYVSFDYLTSTGSTYASNDVSVQVYDVSGSAIVSVQDSNSGNGLLPLVSAPSRFTGWFDTTAGDSNYRVCLNVASTSAVSYAVYFDTIHVGGIGVVPGAIITQWKADTCTSTWTSNTTTTCYTRRVGDSIEINLTASLTGAPTATQLIFTAPSGIVVDTSKLPTQSSTVRSFAFNAHGGSTNYNVQGDLVGTNQIYMGYQNATTGVKTAVNATAPATFASGDYVSGVVSFPVVGWSATIALSSTELMYQTPDAVSGSATQLTPSATGVWHALSGNSVTVGPGKWKLGCHGRGSSPGTAAGFSAMAVGIFGATGTGSGTGPALISTLTGVTLQGGMIASNPFSYFAAGAGDSISGPSPSPTVKTTAASTTFYCDVFTAQTTSANGRIDATMTADRLPDFTVFSTYSGALPAASFITSGTTWTTPTTISTATKVKVTLLGGGGGGGGVKLTTGSKGAGGGGSGGVCVVYLTGLTPNTGYTIAIGGGGSGGSTTGGTGGTGGATTLTVAGTTYSAGGGAGGGGQTGSEVVGGGAPGVGTNCSINGYGGYGQVGLGSTLGLGGAGATPPVPGGGYSVAVGGSTAGSNAVNYGAGGGGATAASTTGFAGGTGSQGFILVEYPN